ncbi:MAG: xanthine dehydrogenase accessory protein XdhC [Pseudomonadota bacterium]
MSFDRQQLDTAIGTHGRVVRVLVASHRGSVPRETGSVMLVWPDGQSGSIGGGALEWEALRTARRMLVEGPEVQLCGLALGPALAQCCGGTVTLVHEVFDRARLDAVCPSNSSADVARPVADDAADIPPTAHGMPTLLSDGWLIEARTLLSEPVWIWGAGHVGRALAATLTPVPGIGVTVVDTDASRLTGFPDGVDPLAAEDPARLTVHAPPTASHYIMTYSHSFDLDICHGLLRRGFGFAGLIGSATKWARFRNRLAALGHSSETIARIQCPIGDPGLGKHPQEIALGVAAAHLARRKRFAMCAAAE